MSFILNALRKSERERQALQAENVTDKILLPQPPQSTSKASKLLVFLFIANVVVISGVVWFIRNNLMSTADTTLPAASPTLPAQDAKIEAKTIAKSVPPKRPTQKSESEIASIAELIDKEKQEPAPSQVKPVITKKPATDAAKRLAMTNDSEPQIQTAPAAKVEPEEPETIPVRKDIPFLNDLPFEFRQTLPKFTVNVFVYSKDPEERFIMIDMVKYKSGQQIKDAMLLKEILPDSFVVEYQNREFQIKRP
ncbi:MAG: general secretion pathway protein GspB [Methylobacter sp.]